MEAEKRFTFRVGAFVIAGLVLLGVMIFILGGKEGFLSRHVRYTASFDSIDGLKAGSPVRLAGVEIGQVAGINFYEDPADRRVRVTLDLRSTYADRIRQDSRASIGSRGVLGDKVIDISLGSPEMPLILPGSEIEAGSSADYTEIIKKGAEVIDNTLAITSDLRELVSSYNTPEMREGVGELIGSTRDVVKAIQSGDGALHALIFDPKVGKDMSALVASSARAAEKVDASIARVDSVLAQLQSGKGLLGTLIYDKKGEKLVSELGAAANEIALLVEAIRTEEDGLLHSLVYGGEGGSNPMEDLAAASKDLRDIVARVNDGEGSLGALINDPTVYEDLKTILGNVKRNWILRTLVRTSISNQEEIESFGKRE